MSKPTLFICADKTPPILRCNYTNHKGEYAPRRVEVINIYFGSNQYHPEPQWLMLCRCLDRQAERVFAMKDMKDVVRE